MIDDTKSEVLKKRLLVAVDTFFPKRDGVVVFLEKIIPSLSELFDVTILAPRFAKDLKLSHDAKVITLPVSDFGVADYKSVKFSYKNVKVIKKAVREADIVWSQDLALIGALAIFYGKEFKKPVVNFVHQITWEQAADVLPIPRLAQRVLHNFLRYAVRVLYNKCDLLMVPYQELASDLDKRGVHSNKVVVPLGVSVDKFFPSLDKSSSKSKVGLDPRSLVVGYCGRVSREKDLRTLRLAFVRVKDHFPNAVLLVVGDGLESEVKRLKDTPGVVVTGFVRDPSDFYKAMDVFVLPSLTETTSLATLEAMSSSLPVLVTRVGHMQDYIINRYNGMFFPPKNSYLLRKKLEVLLGDKDLRDKLGKFARETVVERFSWSRSVALVKKALLMF